MKIVFHGQLLNHTNKTGIAWAAHHFILELAKYPENECIIQIFSLFHKKENLKNLKVYEDAGCWIDECRWFPYALYKILWLILPIPYQMFFHSKPDITQFFDFTAPPGIKGAAVTFIHDMAYRAYPKTVSFKTRNWLRASMKRTCQHADHIITISEFSKKEIVKYLKVPDKQITVVPCAVDHTVYHPGYSKTQIQNTKEKYGIDIDREYFLYLGTIEPRKNLEQLICAYAKLVQIYEKQKEKVPLLVLAGGRGWNCRQIYEKAKALQLHHQVYFTGYIEQKDSPALMCGALAFVFPSVYEGFGMPPLEAMACGTSVIVSNTSSLPEVIKDAGILVNPTSKKEIYEAMKKVLEDTAFRRELEIRARKRAQTFTWQKSADKLMKVYKTLLAKQSESWLEL